MTTPDRTVGRLRPVRLTDVPLKIRRAYGRSLYDRAADDGNIALALALDNAVEHPSDRVYWVDDREARRVLGR